VRQEITRSRILYATVHKQADFKMPIITVLNEAIGKYIYMEDHLWKFDKDTKAITKDRVQNQSQQQNWRIPLMDLIEQIEWRKILESRSIEITQTEMQKRGFVVIEFFNTDNPSALKLYKSCNIHIIGTPELQHDWK
jgi:hypothetical protein